MIKDNYLVSGFLNLKDYNNSNKHIWIAGKPSKVIELNDEIKILIPFKKQDLIDDDIIPSSNIPDKMFWLSIVAYNDETLRVYLSKKKIKRTINDSPVIKFDSRFHKTPLKLFYSDNQWVVKDSKNNTKATISLKKPEINYWSDLIESPQEFLQLDLFPDGTEKKISLNSYDHFFPKRKGSLPLALIENNNKITDYTLSFSALPHEYFSGTGERFSKLDLSGSTFNLINQDGQGVNSRRVYKNVPFYLSSRLYGVFFNTHSHCKISFKDYSSKSVQFLSNDSHLDFFIFGGGTIEKIVKNYRCITGFPSTPPLWSYGIWMSKMTYTSENEINTIVEKLQKNEFPFDVIHIDTGWFREDWLCEWKFNRERFPDPKKFIQQLKSKGVKVSLWQLPYISKGAIQAEEALNNKFIGLSVGNKNNSDSNFGVEDYLGTIDFTNPDAVLWYKNILKELLEMGVKCIKADFGEEIHMDAKYHGMDAKRLHNVYPLLYQKAVSEITKETTKDSIIWARAGWAGCQRFPVHWGGDAEASWNGMSASLKGALHLGLSGFAHWSSDVPGFHGYPNFMNSIIPDNLYVRWTQFSVFSSHIRYHGTSDREPYHFPKVESITQAWWRMRYALIPYIKELSETSAYSGYPIIRALIFEHPEDKISWAIDDQYYFGPSILVAPIFNDSGVRDIYIPEGLWVNFYNGEEIIGGKWLKSHTTGLDKIPVWIKKNSAISIYPDIVSNTDEMIHSKIIRVEINDSFNGIKSVVNFPFF
ncbi:MAG: alpha-xylosidase [Jejuia sp.]